MTNQQPRPYDAILGGQPQAPIDAAVLGGIEGVQQKLASDNEAVKKEGILQALNYGEKGIEALFGILKGEKSLEIQWLTHQTLEKQGDPGIKARLKNYFGWYEYESVTVNRRGEIIKRTPGRAKYYQEDLDNGVYLDMVYIAGGSFLMGSRKSEHKSLNSVIPENVGLRHQVAVPQFWIGKYEVTQIQWAAIMGKNPAYFKGANRPVECVSWDECQEYCHKLSRFTGKSYRLPSEAEWEYACRAGTKTPFNCGETITTDLANYNGNSTYAKEEKGLYRQETVDVGSFPPNRWGLYDMHGNVCERCEDVWHDTYRWAPIDGSARTDNPCKKYNIRVIRGGCWAYVPSSCRSGKRFYTLLDYRDRNNTLGFRLVLEPGRN